MSIEPGAIEALGLFLTRTSALVLAAPLFGVALPVASARIGLIAVLAGAAWVGAGSPTAEVGGPVAFSLMALRELTIGLSLAFVLQCAVLAVRVAGELIGHEMAFNMATVVDPSGVNSPLITQLYEGLFMLGLFALNGHHLVVRALADSFTRAPVADIGLPSGLAETALRLFSDMFAAGLTFAAPVLVVLTLVSILIGLLARAVPQINVLEVGFTLRIAVALVAMLAFAPLLAPAMNGLYVELARGLDEVLSVLQG